MPTAASAMRLHRAMSERLYLVERRDRSEASASGLAALRLEFAVSSARQVTSTPSLSAGYPRARAPTTSSARVCASICSSSTTRCALLSEVRAQPHLPATDPLDSLPTRARVQEEQLAKCTSYLGDCHQHLRNIMRCLERLQLRLQHLQGGPETDQRCACIFSCIGGAITN